MQTFRGYIDPLTTDLKKEKSKLAERAQRYFRYNSCAHDANANVLVYKLDDSGCVVIDTDDKQSFDWVEMTIKRFPDFAPNQVNRTPSISNVFDSAKDENKYKYHYWFSTERPIEKKLGVNGTKLDILTKELVFEVIGHEHRQKMVDIDWYHGFFRNIMLIPGPNLPKLTTATRVDKEQPDAVDAVEEAPECQEELQSETLSTDIDAKKAWIDVHTKVSDSHNYKSWSETLFKIYNKYGDNNIGRKLAHYFSMKDVSYNAEKVDYFWNRIKKEKIDKCVFGLTRLELNESLNQMFLNYQTELIQLTKDRNKKEKKQEKRDASEDEEYQGESTVDAVIVSNATDETVAIEAFELIKKDFIYSRGQYFFKKDNLWNNNVETFKSALRSAVLNLKVLYPKKIETDFGEKTIYVKYCTFVSKLNAVVTLVKDSITLTNDDSFYDKLHSSVKGKLVFKDGVYDFAKKEFFVWGCEHLLKNPVYSVSCCPHNFPTEDSVSREFKDKCIDTIYGAYTKKHQTDMLQFLARAVAGHIEDKNFAQQLMNRDSGKGVQCEWIMYALGALYVGSVDYANFITQQNTSDDSAKANGWLMPFQFKRLMLTNESKGDIADKKIKLDGGKIKSICSGGDAIEARALFCNAVNIYIQSTLMILCNDMLPCTTPDVFEKCLQISGQSQFKSQEFIDEKMAEAENRPELQELYKRQYRLEDDTIKDVVKNPEWSAAFIRIMIDNYQTKRVHITKIENNGDDENEMSLNENILENYTVGSDDDFISNEDLKANAPEFKVSLKKLKQGIFFCFQNAKEGKRTVVDKGRLKGICGIKYIVVEE